MKTTMAARIRALQDMTVLDLRERYREVFGGETRSRHRSFLRKQIALRIQANEEGGLSERARRRGGPGGGRRTSPTRPGRISRSRHRVAPTHSSSRERGAPLWRRIDWSVPMRTSR